MIKKNKTKTKEVKRNSKVTSNQCFKVSQGIKERDSLM